MYIYNIYIYIHIYIHICIYIRSYILVILNTHFELCFEILYLVFNSFPGCLIAFLGLTEQNTKNCISFILHNIITYINIYSTIYYRWLGVDAWYLEECFAITVMWTISRYAPWSYVVVTVWGNSGMCSYLWKSIRWGVESKLFERCFFSSVIKLCSAWVQHWKTFSDWKKHDLSSFCLWPSKLCML